MNGISDQTNQVYIFIPFYLKDDTFSFQGLRDQLIGQGVWESNRDEIRHLYRYITDKMDISHLDECLYFHLHLVEKEKERLGFGRNGIHYSIKPKDEYGFNDVTRFKVMDVHLFGFRTMINIIGIQILFDSCDPLYIATGLYYLKKPKRERLWDENVNIEKSLFELITGLFDDSLLEHTSFFFYLNTGMERSNTMSLTFHQPDAELEREMYFLKNCYRGKGFDYTPEQKNDDELLVTSNDYIWGVTEENLACIITKDTEHIHNGFIKHFGEQYLIMYVLLLHRKYDLYRILTDIGVGQQRDLQSLKHYKELLYEYQTDYSFERITEVPQYHLLYKKLEQKMDLNALFSDVMEPITSLSQLRQEKTEEEALRRNSEIENALGLLSVLTVFSALIDCYSYVETIKNEFFNINNLSIMTIIQLAFSIMIIGTVVFVIHKIKNRK